MVFLDVYFGIIDILRFTGHLAEGEVEQPTSYRNFNEG